MRFSFNLLLLILLNVSFYSYANDVKVIYPDHKSVTQKLILTGTVMAKQDAHLASLEEGLVETLFVEAGDQVITGQTLMNHPAEAFRLGSNSLREEGYLN